MTATFTRNSTAFKQDGTLVNTNLPRYELTRLPRPPVWQDLFDTDQLATQYVSGGDTPATWAVSGGVLSGAGGVQATLLKTGLTLADGEIAVNVSQAHAAGIIARHVDNHNYYLLTLSDDSGGFPAQNVRLLRRIAGIFSVAAFADVVWARGTPAHIRLTFHGSRLEAWVNDVRVISVGDPNFTAGSVGLRNSTPTAAHFMDFTVAETVAHQVQPAIMAEESTTNLLTANQASVETDLTGFVSHATGVTLTRDTAQRRHGNASIRADCNGAESLQGLTTTDIATVASEVNTATVEVFGSSPLELILQEYTNAGVWVGNSVSRFVATSAWTRYSVTRAFGATGVWARIVVVTPTAQAATFWADGLALEQKPFATSWHLPGSSRAAETLTVPSASFNRGNWTVEGIYTPQIPMNVGNVLKTLTAYQINASNNMWFGVTVDGRFRLAITSGGVIRAVESAAGAAVQGTPYLWQISGNGTHMMLCVNGAQIATDTTYTEPVGTMPANIHIGVRQDNTAHANGLLRDIRFSNRAKTLAEHQATFSAGLPLTVDGDSTLYTFNATLAAVWGRVFTATARAAASVSTILQQIGGAVYEVIVSATTRASGAVVKQINKATSATAGTTASTTKQTGKVLTATAGVSAAVTKAIHKVLSATAGASATIAKQTGKVLSATTNASASVVKSTQRTIPATAATAASVVKQTGKAISATATTGASVLKQVGKRVLATARATATAMAEQVYHRVYRRVVRLSGLLMRSTRLKGLVVKIRRLMGRL